MSSKIRVDEWLKELDKLSRSRFPDNREYKTTRDLAEEWNCSKDKVLQLLNIAKKSGRLEGPVLVARVSLNGRSVRSPAYRIKKGAVSK